MTQAFSQSEQNLVNDPIHFSSDNSLTLSETLSLPSTPSITAQTPTNTFPLNCPINLDDRSRELVSTNMPLRLDWNTYVAPPPLFGQHLDSNRLYKRTLNRLQYRHHFCKDTQEHNIQILSQGNKTLKLEITMKLNNLVHHPLQLSLPNITAQPLPLHLSQQNLSINTIDIQKKLYVI